MNVRRRAIILSVLAFLMIGIAIVLSGGIGSVDLQPGVLVETGRVHGGQGIRGASGVHQDVTLPSDRIFTGFLLFLLGATVVSALFMVVDKKTRPKLLFGLLTLGILIVIGLVFPERAVLEDTQFAEIEGDADALDGPLPGPTSDTGNRVVVEAPQSSEGTRWPLILALVFAGLLVLLAATPLVLLVIRWVRARRRESLRDDADELLAIAEDAANEIASGSDPIGAVQRCYSRMLEALSERSGVDPLYRTPREFAGDMRDAGLHSQSVDALTEMFELVRYGGRADNQFAQRAHACLTALRLSHEAA